MVPYGEMLFMFSFMSTYLSPHSILLPYDLGLRASLQQDNTHVQFCVSLGKHFVCPGPTPRTMVGLSIIQLNITKSSQGSQLSKGRPKLSCWCVCFGRTSIVISANDFVPLLDSPQPHYFCTINKLCSQPINACVPICSTHPPLSDIQDALRCFGCG